jgi:hypothetical protein
MAERAQINVPAQCTATFLNLLTLVAFSLVENADLSTMSSAANEALHLAANGGENVAVSEASLHFHTHL